MPGTPDQSSLAVMSPVLVQAWVKGSGCGVDVAGLADETDSGRRNRTSSKLARRFIAVSFRDARRRPGWRGGLRSVKHTRGGAAGERAILNFHRFSVAVWAVWVTPYFCGVVMGMRG
jgi:hypothetical protein